MPFFERGPIRMHYEIFDGLVERDTVAFHGNLASNTWWKPAVETLSLQRNTEKKGRLVLAEWRGCGKSTGLREEKELNLKEMAEDYNGLLRSLGLKDACALGHSTGCLIALYAMRQAPELYNRALLLDPVAATGVQFGPEMYAAFTQMSQDRAFCAAVMAGTINVPVEPTLMNQIVDDAFGVHPLVWHGVAKMLHDVDFRSELPSIPQPVLVLHGEHDLLLPKENSKALAESLPNGKFLELPGRGHSSNVEDPGLFVSHMRNFLYG
jgi:3-oxoadipate enol-lactonase